MRRRDFNRAPRGGGESGGSKTRRRRESGDGARTAGIASIASLMANGIMVEDTEENLEEFQFSDEDDVWNER